jgi:hypothetical protein
VFQPNALLLAHLAVCCGGAFAQEKGQPDPGKAPGAGEKATVEVYLAAEHLPKGLKAGDRADLHRVNGKTVTGTGKVSYSVATVAPDVEVVSVTRVDKPKAPEQAVKAVLRVTKSQAAMIERAKAQLVTERQTTPDGGVKREQKPVTFRLEPAIPEKR